MRRHWRGPRPVPRDSELSELDDFISAVIEEHLTQPEASDCTRRLERSEPRLGLPQGGYPSSYLRLALLLCGDIQVITVGLSRPRISGSLENSKAICTRRARDASSASRHWPQRALMMHRRSDARMGRGGVGVALISFSSASNGSCWYLSWLSSNRSTYLKVWSDYRTRSGSLALDRPSLALGCARLAM